MNPIASSAAATSQPKPADAPIDPRNFSNFADFYPFYLREHSNPVCRWLHFTGSSLTLICLGALAATRNPWWILAGLLCGYGFAWIGHFGFEKNRPASFKRPLYSFMGDWMMYRDIWVQIFRRLKSSRA